MSKLQSRVLALCIFIFIVFAVLAVFIILYFIKQTTKLIKNGAEDETLKKEYEKKETKQTKKIFNIIAYSIICLVFVAISLLCVLPKFTCDGNKITTPSMLVVKSTSMSEKNSKNVYLDENDLDNQFDMFDILFIKKLPDEFELKLYDIVVYEYEGYKIIHRIVNIEEPNSAHPEKRLFKLQGDAVGVPDAKMVTYDQMVAIYSNKSIPFLGSFILYIQSIPGILCVIAIAVALIIEPILKSKLDKVAINRLIKIGYLSHEYEEENNKSNDKLVGQKFNIKDNKIKSDKNPETVKNLNKFNVKSISDKHVAQKSVIKDILVKYNNSTKQNVTTSKNKYK